MKKFFKTALIFVCYGLAFFTRKRPSPAVLMYHSFDNVGWRYGVPPEIVQEQVNYLCKNKKIVPISEIIDFAKGDAEIDPNSVAISIDDGYEDTYLVFFQIAKRYKIPFTLFLTTDLSVRKSLGGLNRPNWDQIKEMFNSGLVTIGLHGHTHEHFPTVMKLGIEVEEINNSIDLINKKLGLRPNIAAYPSGRYNQDVINLLKSAGIQAAFATHSGFIKKGDDLFRLRRIEVGRNIPSLFLFKLRLTPALDVYNRFVRSLKKTLYV